MASNTAIRSNDRSSESLKFSSESFERPVERLGYTVAEACKAIPCSRSHLYRAIKQGHLRAAKDGKKVLISRQAIIDYLDQGDDRPVPPPSAQTS